MAREQFNRLGPWETLIQGGSGGRGGLKPYSLERTYDDETDSYIYKWSKSGEAPSIAVVSAPESR